MADLPLSDINSDSDRMLPVSPCEGVETAMHELLPGGLLYCDARSMGIWSAGHPGHSSFPFALFQRAGKNLFSHKRGEPPDDMEKTRIQGIPFFRNDDILLSYLYIFIRGACFKKLYKLEQYVIVVFL